MPKFKNTDSDIFVRRPVLELRDRLDRNKILEEADVAGSEAFMEASIAAGAIIAHADGSAEVAEYRRIIGLFKAHPILKAFSVDDIAREIADHEAAFALHPQNALRRAREQIRHANLTDHQFKTLISLCQAVVEADTLTHPSEQQALEDILSLRRMPRS